MYSNEPSHDAHDDDDDDDTSSVDTNEAFLEFLGLSQDNAHIVTTAISSDDAAPLAPQSPPYPLSLSTTSSASASSSSPHSPRERIIKITPIEIPSKCSRHFIHPSSCFALVLENVLATDQCQFLIEKATSAKFRYITEATHKAPDGSSYTVQIQNPNPHNLSVIDTFHNQHHHHHHQQQQQQQQRSCNSNIADDERRDQFYKNNAACASCSTTDVATQIMDELYCKIYSTLKDHPLFLSFQKRLQAGNMQGLNPRMRILKYDAQDNDLFDAHFDATTFVPGNDGTCKQRQSLITVLLYLNNGGGKDFDGGETLYLDCDGTANMSTIHVALMTKKQGLDKKKVVKVVPKAGNVVVFEHDLFHSGAPLIKGTKYIMRTDVLFQELGVVCQEEQKEKKEHIGSILVSDICEKLELPSDQCSILHNMDLYGSTCEAFLAPGYTMIKSMLVDGGMTETHVCMLLKEVMSAWKKK
jgi:hypothetical protein